MKTVFLPIFFVYILVPQNLCSAYDVVEETCKQATAESKESYGFCMNTLKSHPNSERASREDLFAIASDLAIDGFHHNLAAIHRLREGKELLQGQEEALLRCKKAYERGIAVVEQVFFHFKSEGVSLVTGSVAAAKDQVMACIDAFKDAGIESLLPEENEESMNLVWLASQLIPSTVRKDPLLSGHKGPDL